MRATSRHDAAPGRASRVRVADGSHAGDVDENLERATALVARAVREEADGGIGLLLCPEIGFGRYSLSVESARRAAREEARKIVEWARWAARTLGCHACVGHAREDERTGELFNSQTTGRAGRRRRRVR